ncbi:MAG: hypothetical protein OHK006_12820 [Thermodesulfovibrionales bacterium]
MKRLIRKIIDWAYDGKITRAMTCPSPTVRFGQAFLRDLQHQQAQIDKIQRRDKNRETQC